MSELDLQIAFKGYIIKFIDELVEQFPRMAEFVLIRIFVKDKIPIEVVIGRFIKEVVPHKTQVYEKNDDFFLKNEAIYNSMGSHKHHIEPLKDLWESDKIDDETREVIWQWIHVLVKLAENYKNKYGFVPGWE